MDKIGVDLDSWDKLVESHLKKAEDGEFCEDRDKTFVKQQENEEKDEETQAKSYLTIGCCGFPNVGKSSLLNTLVGRKVVSVSRTPGHTKHLQTIFLTPNVRLCDCPGLVFPSLVPKPLQVALSRPYQVSQYK
jgi:ribosome biogenesis GTPase A